MKLHRFLDHLDLGKRLTHRNLTIIPLHGNGDRGLDYMLGADAICAGLLEITEVSEGGSVPEVHVRSTCQKPVLLLEGEQLIGAKQNRIVNITILLPAKSTTRIPVSCVEAGRWRYASEEFEPGPLSHPKLRARTSHDVTHCLRASGTPHADQGAVWEEVDEALSVAGAVSHTAALADAIEHRKASLDDYLARARYPKGARGILAAIDGQFVALDLFDKPQTCERVWDRLVRSYAFDALPTATAKRRKVFRTAVARRLLEEIAAATPWRANAIGEGEHWRFETEGLVGSALVARRTCVHLAAFPRPGNGGTQAGPISPPSARRRWSDDTVVY